jgi:hypothetical protein
MAILVIIVLLFLILMALLFPRFTRILVGLGLLIFLALFVVGMIVGPRPT